MKVSNSFNKRRENAANVLKMQHKNLITAVFLSYESTRDLIDRYLGRYSNGQAVSHAGLKILSALTLYDGSMTPTELSKKIFRSKNTISRVIHTLGKHSLITISPVGEDRRKRQVRLTPKGLTAARKLDIDAREPKSREVFGALSQEEIESLIAILVKVRKHTLKLIKTKS